MTVADSTATGAIEQASDQGFVDVALASPLVGLCSAPPAFLARWSPPPSFPEFAGGCTQRDPQICGRMAGAGRAAAGCYDSFSKNLGDEDAEPVRTGPTRPVHQPAAVASAAAAFQSAGYLALHRHELHSRPKLGNVLWPDCCEATARVRLNSALHRLRYQLPRRGARFLAQSRGGVVGVHPVRS